MAENRFQRSREHPHRCGALLGRSPDSVQPTPSRWTRSPLRGCQVEPDLSLFILALPHLAREKSLSLSLISLPLHIENRVMHTYSYANSLQPHRALCWTAGILCSLAIAVNALLGAFLL